MTETDNITFQISGLKLGFVSVPTITESGVFTAKYSGSELGCAKGDGKSPASGATDCFIWNGAPNTYSGKHMISDLLSNGETLDVTFNNATDWNIRPTISFDVVASVPEPATWAMMLLGFGGLGFAGYRARAKAVATA